jgi:hypothetical protein
LACIEGYTSVYKLNTEITIKNWEVIIVWICILMMLHTV